MNCSDIVADLAQDAGVNQLTRAARDHLAGCVGCRELLAVVGVPGSKTAASSPENLYAIECRLVSDLRPVRRIAAGSHLLVGFSGVFLLAAGVGVYRLGAHALAVMSPLQAVTILCALAFGSALLARSLVNQMSPGSLHRVSPGSALLAIPLALAIVVAVLFPLHHENHFWMRIGICLKLGTPVGILAALPLWFLLRTGAVLSPKLTGLTAGMFAGLAATAALQIHCPNIEAAHIVLSHLGFAVLASALGFLLGSIAEQFETNGRTA
ncbi:MAG TPA: NrsF family protein [Bryobacteraceae bacterium]|jgi:hypothetical protein